MTAIFVVYVHDMLEIGYKPELIYEIEHINK